MPSDCGPGRARSSACAATIENFGMRRDSKQRHLSVRVWQRPLIGSSVPKTLPDIKAISTMCDRAVILAGGRGPRLRPYTVGLPKPLMPIGPYPILEVVVRQLARRGFRRVTMAVNHQANLRSEEHTSELQSRQ